MIPSPGSAPHRECPSEDDLLQILGAGSPQSWEQLYGHIDVCEPCRLLVADWGRDASSAAAAGDAPALEDREPPRAAAAPAGDDPFIGLAIGNYRITRLIGAGGMGTVYLLVHTRLPNTVAAVKLLKAHRQDARSPSERFTQEAMVASALGDDRVARPFDLGHLPDGTPYILMEYVAGQTIAELIARGGAMEVATTVRIAWAVADTLARAHERGILHRDIKPSNLMVSGDAPRLNVKVLDFGVARATGTLKLTETTDSAVIGSPGYMSPEAASAGEVDQRTDVYSLGATIFHMLTGDVPFPATSRREALAALLTRPAPRVSARRPGHLPPVPVELEALVLRAMAKASEERPTMPELRDVLAGCMERTAKPERAEERRSGQARGRWWTLAALSLLAIASAAVLVVRAQRRAASPPAPAPAPAPVTVSPVPTVPAVPSGSTPAPALPSAPIEQPAASPPAAALASPPAALASGVRSAPAPVRLPLTVEPDSARVVLFDADGTRRVLRGPWSASAGRALTWAADRRPTRVLVEADGYRSAALSLPAPGAAVTPLAIRLQRQRPAAPRGSTADHHDLPYPWSDP